MRELLLTFYGDDFTGSADAMESLSLNGVRSVLFLSPPTPELLREKFPDIEAVGVAGASRAMTPAQMEAELPAIFSQLQKLNARLFHYKVCSTFDSSPNIGSIGKAYEIGQRVFASSFVPLLVGAPALKRYCVFGNLFANSRTLHLHHHGPAVSQCGCMHLTERCRGQRFGLEIGKGLRNPNTQLLIYNFIHLGKREWFDLILQSRKGFDVSLRKEIDPAG